MTEEELAVLQELKQAHHEAIQKLISLDSPHLVFKVSRLWSDLKGLEAIDDRSIPVGCHPNTVYSDYLRPEYADMPQYVAIAKALTALGGEGRAPDITKEMYATEQMDKETKRAIQNSISAGLRTYAGQKGWQKIGRGLYQADK